MLCPAKAYFNPRSPCGERPSCTGSEVGRRAFQSTLPVWGATPERYANRSGKGFQSTLPVWGATRRPGRKQRKAAISIHAPRVGSDSAWSSQTARFSDFNPRSPCGERLFFGGKNMYKSIFQSTLPVWGATQTGTFSPCHAQISIHAPRVGSDVEQRAQGCLCNDFNPRSPCGERPIRGYGHTVPRIFQSTLPVWGATQDPRCAAGQLGISIHAPRVGSDDSSFHFAFSAS